MPVIIALLIAFLLGLIPPLMGIRAGMAWLLSCLVVPAFVLLSESVLPHSGNGAPFWPIVLVFGGILEMMAGGLGVSISVSIVDWQSKKNKKAT